MKKLKNSYQDEEGKSQWLEITNSNIVERQMEHRVLERSLQRTVVQKKKQPFKV